MDDEPQIVRALVISLKARGYDVDAAPDASGALEPAAARHLLEADPSHPRHFITEPGTGYRFEP